jgi:hypothetical protein
MLLEFFERIGSLVPEYWSLNPNFKPEKNVEFRLIHNLSHPSKNSLNDFIDLEVCTVRYAGIDDAVEMIKRIGKGGMLAKVDIKSANSGGYFCYDIAVP